VEQHGDRPGRRLFQLLRDDATAEDLVQEARPDGKLFLRVVGRQEETSRSNCLEPDVGRVEAVVAERNVEFDVDEGDVGGRVPKDDPAFQRSFQPT